MLRARYALIGEVTAKVLLAEDLHNHTQVVLKLAASREKMEHERAVLQMVGPDTAPECYECFSQDETHVLVLEAADSMADLPSFCARRSKAKERDLRDRLLSARAAPPGGSSSSSGGGGGGGPARSAPAAGAGAGGAKSRWDDEDSEAEDGE